VSTGSPSMNFVDFGLTAWVGLFRKCVSCAGSSPGTFRLHQVRDGCVLLRLLQCDRKLERYGAFRLEMVANFGGLLCGDAWGNGRMVGK